MDDEEFVTRILAGDLPVEASADKTDVQIAPAATASLSLPNVSARRPAATNPPGESFRRSDNYLAAQLARLVARGQRML